MSGKLNVIIIGRQINFIFKILNFVACNLYFFLLTSNSLAFRILHQGFRTFSHRNCPLDSVVLLFPFGFCNYSDLLPCICSDVLLHLTVHLSSKNVQICCRTNHYICCSLGWAICTPWDKHFDFSQLSFGFVALQTFGFVLSKCLDLLLLGKRSQLPGVGPVYLVG